MRNCQDSFIDTRPSSFVGKRSVLGVLQDGWNSAVRYYMNNFTDGFRQDSLDLFIGNFAVEDDVDGMSDLRLTYDYIHALLSPTYRLRSLGIIFFYY